MGGFSISALLDGAQPYLSDLLSSVKQAAIDAALKQHVKLLFSPFTAESIAHMIRAYLDLLAFVPTVLLTRWAEEIRGYEDSVQGTTGESLLALVREVRPDIAKVIDDLPGGREWFAWQVDKLKNVLMKKD